MVATNQPSHFRPQLSSLIFPASLLFISLIYLPLSEDTSVLFPNVVIHLTLQELKRKGKENDPCGVCSVPSILSPRVGHKSCPRHWLPLIVSTLLSFQDSFSLSLKWILFLLFLVLGIEHKSSRVASMCSTTERCHPVPQL